MMTYGLLNNYMLEKVVQSILRRYFGQFITGLDKVELAFWTGKIHIQNASFKHIKINQLLQLHNIPLTIKFSFLGSLEIDIPWNKLSSAPVEIKVSNVLIVFKLEKVMDHAKGEELRQNAKLLLIKNYLTYLNKKLEEVKNQGEGDSGFIKKLLVKVLHNVNLQVNNIHIRIENHNNKIEISSLSGSDVFEDCEDEASLNDIAFSLGFCIESLDALTINSKNQKKFVQVQNDRSEIRKKINLKQISLYWQENNNANLYEYSQEQKINFMQTLILRQQHRLLTIDGQLLMEKNKQNYDYFFSSNLRLLEVKLNYAQLKQMMEVLQQFDNAKARKKMVKSKELSQVQQLKKQADFKQLFQHFKNTNFNQVNVEHISLIEGIDKKLLMKWTKEESIATIKQQKMKNAYESKNRKSWLSILSRNAEIDLSPEDLDNIEKDIDRLIEAVDNGKSAKSIGFYLLFQSLQMSMDHHRVNQNLLFSAYNIELQFQNIRQCMKLSAMINDISLVYKDLINKSQVEIFRKRAGAQTKLLQFQMENSKQQQAVSLEIEAVMIIHQIQFLSFIAELVKLKQREQDKSNGILMRAEALKQASSSAPEDPVQNNNQKIYKYYVAVKQIDIIVQLDSQSQLYAYIQGIKISHLQTEVNSHSAEIINFGITYLKLAGDKKEDKILDDLNIQINLRKGLKEVTSGIPLLRIVLNEQSLYSIANCLESQYRSVQIRSAEYTNDIIEQEKYMEGELEIMSVFKKLNVYHAVLCDSDLYFYFKEQATEKVDYGKVGKTISILNAKVTRVDQLSFIIKSLLVNEIIKCKTREEVDKWMYQIEQRIFENNSKMKMFAMMEEEADRQPNIFFRYDSKIEMRVNKLEIIYEKNDSEKILAVELSKLAVVLKENNFLFERNINLQQIKLTNLSLGPDIPEEYSVLLSNMVNYFEDFNEDDEDQQRSHISVLIEGKKKTHPKYTGEVTVKSKVNKLFVNYNAEFLYELLARLMGQKQEKAFSQPTKKVKILQMLKQILEQRNGIQQRYQNGAEFEYDRSYVQLQEYRQKYPCLVLFHVEMICEQIQINLVNGRNNFWLNKIIIENVSLQIDKSTDFMFMKIAAKHLSINDITGYPNTNTKPFTQLPPYPIVGTKKIRKSQNAVQVFSGVFEPLIFINKQRFKNYLTVNLYDQQINYQQQPTLRFVDYLTNQIILFMMEPASLHRYDTPNRGPYVFGPINFTAAEVKKILFQSIHPFYTHLNITGFNLDVHFNSHPYDEYIAIKFQRLKLISMPQIDSRRIRVSWDDLNRLSTQENIMQQIRRVHESLFKEKVTHSQWVTKYIISASGCRCSIIENQFLFLMEFQRSNHNDKDIVLPFLSIKKDLVMRGRIKNMNINAPKPIYNLINKCFMFNLSYDDRADRFYNTNYQFQHLNPQSKLIFSLNLDQLSIIIPEINKTVIIIPNCEYQFVRYENMLKEMKLNGRSLHILVDSQRSIITPLHQKQKDRGLQFLIEMSPSGAKTIHTILNQINFNYNQQTLFPLFKYFLLDQSCYPKQDTFPDLPFIKCETLLINSHYNVVENKQDSFALKGNITVVWNRFHQPHPETYKINKALFPQDKQGSSYVVKLNDIIFYKYKKDNDGKMSQYQSLSSPTSPMTFKFQLTNHMKMSNDIVYSDMWGDYNIENINLKLSYRDVMKLMEGFQPAQSKKIEEERVADQESSPQRRLSVQNSNYLGYTPHSKHKVKIKTLSIQFGLSQLPVPLLQFGLHNSDVDVEMLGQTKNFTTVLQYQLKYWNMMIGRWQPVVEKSFTDLKVRMGPKEMYLLATSTRPVLLNFSIEYLKVLKLVWQDIQEKGNLHVINRQQCAAGSQISPYVITNRTGFTLIIESHAIIKATLRNNDKTHLQSKSLELDKAFDTVYYQIEGDPNKYKLYLNLIQTQKTSIEYNGVTYLLIVWAISSPVVKQIVISSPYIIHNRTIYPFVLTVGVKDYHVQPDSKVAIPFTEQLTETKLMKLEFAHLPRVKQNYNFQYKYIEKGYEHYIIYDNDRMFNCLVEFQHQSQNVIAVSPLCTFVNLLPMNIKIELAITKLSHEKYMIQELMEISKEYIFYQFGSRDEVSLRILLTGFHPSTFKTIDLSNNKEFTEINEEISFVDYRGCTKTVKSKLIRKNKKKIIYFYAESVLINETAYKFYISNQKELVPGQRLKGIPQSDTKYVFMNDIQHPQIGFSDEDFSQVLAFNTSQLGSQQLSVPNYDQLVQLVVINSLYCLQEEAQIFTTVLKVLPRYVIVNRCTRKIVLRQKNTDYCVYFKVGEKRDWTWYHREQTKQLKISVMDNEIEMPNGWDFSAPFSLDHLQQIIFVIRPLNNSSQRLLIKLQLFKESEVTYIVFKELRSQEDSLIIFKNNLKLVNLQIYQECLTLITKPWSLQKHFQCNSLKQIDFGWDQPSQEHTVMVQFNFLGPYRSKYNSDIVKLDLDSGDKVQLRKFKSDDDEQLQIEIEFEVVGRRRKITFKKDETNSNQNENEDFPNEVTRNNMGISFEYIGVSIIGGREPRSEIMFMQIKKLQLIMMQKQQKRNYELKVKYINIDNNLNHNTIYPVLFTPLKQRKTREKSRPFFVCLVQQNLKTKQIVEFNYFRICVEPISIKLYDQIVTKLYDMKKEFSSAEQKKKEINYNSIFRSYETRLEWEQYQLVKEGSSVFIREVEIGKVIIQVSFSIRSTYSGNIVIYTILTLFKTALSNVSESQIKLSRFHRKDVNLGQLTRQLGEFYRKELFKEIYKIPGSINLLGNPYVFIKYIAEGAWEIVNQPSEGFIKGPVEGAVGIVLGVVYCTRNVVAGTFNSLQVITETCSRSISSVTFDQKFITRRDKIQMQKSRHLWQGTKSAVFALYTGFEVAVTGIYRHPAQNYQQNGIPGMFKGILIGTAGLFTKPLSGFFQAVSKFSQGVKQTALFFLDGPNTTRSRPPRIFISDQQYYTQYNGEQSQAINLLQFHSTKHLKKTVLVVSVDKVQDSIMYTVLTSQYLVLLSKDNKKIVKELEIGEIKDVAIDGDVNQNRLRLLIGDDDEDPTDQIIIITHKTRQFLHCLKTIIYGPTNSESEQK